MEENHNGGNKSRLWLIVFFALLVLITMVWMAVAGSTPQPDRTADTQQLVQATTPPAERMPAPDVILNDQFDRTVTLKGAMSTPRYYYFWASWCGVCEQQNPQVYAAYQKYGAMIDFYAINLTNTEEADTLKTYIEQKPFPFVMLFDPEAAVTDAYGVKGTPTQVFISKSGKIVDRTYALSAEELDQRLSSLLSQE